MRIVAAPHPASLPDDVLLTQCTITFGRSSGPGGQHRNKVETAVRIAHEPTGITAGATERRSQYQNRSEAIRRLRLTLARDVRTRVDRERHEPSDLWKARRQGRTMSINPKHRDYPGLLAEALDVVHARKFDVAGAAGILGITMSQLAKLIRHDKQAFARINEGRIEMGMPPLR
jgi:hypothetical protein